MGKPVFKKGEAVTVFIDTDQLGTVAYRQARVHSCGMKRLLLISDKTGEMFGTDMKPELGSVDTPQSGYYISWVVFRRLEGEALQSTALQIATFNRAAHQKYWEDRITRYAASTYIPAAKEHLAAMHEPQVIEYYK